MSKRRRVCVVMNDEFLKLHLIEVMAEARKPDIDRTFRVNRTAAEAAARDILRSEGRADDLNFVGILVAHDDLLTRGRITWAEEVFPTEAVCV